MRLPKAANCSPEIHVKEIRKNLEKLVSWNGRSQSSKYFERNLGRAVATREGLPGARSPTRGPRSASYFLFSHPPDPGFSREFVLLRY